MVLIFNSGHFSIIVSLLVILLSNVNDVFVSGELEVLTPKETDALNKLRPLVEASLYKDYMKTDSYLLRWLRHYNLDHNRAANLIQSAIQWRKDNNIDSILEEDFSEFEKIFPYDMDSVDQEGRPVWILPFGKWDVRKVGLAGQIREYNRFQDYLYEKIETKIRELDGKDPSRNITQFVLLIDMQGYNLRQQGCLACIPGNTHFILAYERYFSGSAFRSFLVNTPAIFDQLFEILQPLMSPATRKVIKVYGYDQKEWLAVLHQYISPNQLPPRFGGTKIVKAKTKAKN